MAHLSVFNSPKIPRGPRGIGSGSPNPRGMKKCNPRFLKSPRNENRWGIGIPKLNSPWGATKPDVLLFATLGVHGF